MSVETDSGIIWRKPVPTHAISVFNVGGSGESSENARVNITGVDNDGRSVRGGHCLPDTAWFIFCYK